MRYDGTVGKTCRLFDLVCMWFCVGVSWNGSREEVMRRRLKLKGRCGAAPFWVQQSKTRTEKSKHFYNGKFATTPLVRTHTAKLRSRCKCKNLYENKSIGITCSRANFFSLYERLLSVDNLQE